jgi:hypothetical protein
LQIQSDKDFWALLISSLRCRLYIELLFLGFYNKTFCLLSNCCNVQLVSLAQAGHELTPDIIKTAGK